MYVCAPQHPQHKHPNKPPNQTDYTFGPSYPPPPPHTHLYLYTFIHIPPTNLSPPGYWIEVISRDASKFGPTYPAPYTFAQTMLRVKDPKASLRFYRDLLGTIVYVCI